MIVELLLLLSSNQLFTIYLNKLRMRILRHRIFLSLLAGKLERFEQGLQ